MVANMKLVRTLSAFLLLLIAFGCSETPTVPHSVTIMTFNVENLFDNVDDPDKADRDYLPIEQKQNDEHRAACMEVEVESWRNRCLTINWNDEILRRKLEVVAEAILQVDGGRGPDIIALQEIENIGILERLRTEFLADADYLPGVLVEGWDARGIDVAFLTRLPVQGQPQLHEIEFDAEFADRRGDTRGILQADFVLPDGSLLSGFSVHFPAPFHPTPMRVSAYERLNQLANALPEDRHVFAAGDFNTTSVDDRDNDMLNRFARPGWIVSNDLCAGCKGTAYYSVDGTWSYLDMILWRKCCGARTTWGLRENPVAIANQTDQQVMPDGTPRRFKMPEGTGVSDHWPVIFRLESK
jgi:endonuclease/exonuclease/phosphatase family metal-dependent hydrolase